MLLPTLLVVLVVGFGHLVMAGYFAVFDYWLSHSLNLAEGTSPSALIAAMQTISWIGGGVGRYIVVAFLLGLIVVYGKSWRLAGGLAVTVILANLASASAKVYFARARPDLTEHLSSVSSMSFPSGHTTTSVAMALLFFFIMRGKIHSVWLWMVGLYALLCSLSRIFLAVHWPTDIIAGTLLGTAFALAGYEALKLTGDMNRG